MIWMWPIALVCGVTLITYWLAGLSKVWGPAGWSWAIGDNLRNQVAYDTLNKELLGNYEHSLARFFFDHPYVLIPGSIIALPTVTRTGTTSCAARRRAAGK